MKKLLFILSIISSLAFGTACPIVNGCTNTGTQTSAGITYFDGTKITSNNVLTFDGSQNLYFSSSQADPQIDISTSVTDVPNSAGLNLYRGDAANGNSFVGFGTNGTIDWFLQTATTSSNFSIRNVFGGGDALIINKATNRINIPTLTESHIVGTDESKNLVSVDLVGDVTSSGLATAITNNAVTTAKIADNNVTNAKIESIAATKIAGLLAESQAGTGADLTSCASGALFFQGTPATSFNCTGNLVYGAGGLGIYNNATIAAAAVTAPTTTTQLNINSTIQASARIVLSGQEFYQAANTSTNGVSLLAGVNRTGNRQLWIADSAALTQNSSNATIRIQPNTGTIDATATDGTTALPLVLGQTGSATTINGSSTQISGGNVGIGATPSTYNILVKGAGSSSAGNSLAYFGSVTTATAGNLYGITIDKNGTQSLLIGVNKNSTTGSVAADSAFISTFSSAAPLSIGRGGNNNLPSTTDIGIDGSGNVTIGNGNLSLATSGKTLNFSNNDTDKILLMGSTNSPKIDHGSGWAFNFRAGAQSVGGDSGLFNFYTSTGSTWTNKMSLSNTGDLALNTGGVSLATAGKTVTVKTGTNACAGSGAALTAGTATVNTTCATAGSLVFITRSATSGTAGVVTITLNAGTGFTLNSSSGSDASTFGWWIQHTN